MDKSWLFLLICYCTNLSRMVLATITNNIFLFSNFLFTMIPQDMNEFFWIKKVKNERRFIASIFYKFLTCVSCHHAVITKTIITRGRIYSDIKILHVSDTRVIVLQLNVQTGIPNVGQVMKIFISCNHRKSCFCEFRREKEREREKYVGGCGWVWIQPALRQKIQYFTILFERNLDTIWDQHFFFHFLCIKRFTSAF